MGDNRTGDQGDETVDREQRSGETLGMRGIQVQTVFEHISKDGNNEAEKEGFLIVYRLVSVKREYEGRRRTSKQSDVHGRDNEEPR